MRQPARTSDKPGKSKKGKSKYSAELELNQIDWDKTENIFRSDRENFLKNIKNKAKISPRTKDLLKLLAGGAVLGVSLAFPTVPMVIAPFVIPRHKFAGNYFSQSLDRLKNQKLVEVVYENGQTVVRITQAGRLRALRYKLCDMRIKRPKVWDGKWRIVIFDIPEKHRRARDIFRRQLKSMQFRKLQESVWVHPYPCFDEIEFLRQIYKVGIDVTYILAEKIEGYKDLKEHFNSN